MTTNDASTDYVPRRHAGFDEARAEGKIDRAVADAGREPLVHVHRARVGDAIAALFGELDQLSSRLHPVLVFDQDGGKPATVSAIEQAPAISDVAGHLDGFANDINILCERLRDLVRRLDI